MSSPFTQAAPLPAGPETAVASRFRYWQYRTLIATMFGYAAFYLVRKNLSFAMPGMQDDLGITKASLGLFLTLHGLLYGVSRFVNGMWADRANARYFMVAGLLLSVGANVFFGFSSTVLLLGVAWMINGWVQGMGFPPCCRLMTHWFPPETLATRMSIWNTSHSIGAWAAAAICPVIAVYYGWRWVFFGPAILCTIAGLILFIMLRDTPTSVGLPEITDGTIYKGGTLFSCTLPFIAQMRELGIGCTFLTNNPSKSSADYLAHLRKMGLAATADELYTSAQATIDRLRWRFPEVKKIFALGTPSMLAEFRDAGFELAADDAGDVPDAVVVGFDMTLAYARVGRAAWWIQQGRLFVATNPDRVCPTDQPTVLIDCGSICAMIEKATGRAPDIVLGKPDPAMLGGILDRHRLRPSQIAMVGDRIYTDILMAHRADAFGVLVLTGEATARDAEQANPRPHLVVPSLFELGALLAEARGVNVPT